MQGMTADDLISAIERFSGQHGLAPATVTNRAVGNSRLYARLKSGKGCTIQVAKRLMDYMSSCPDGQKEAR